MKKSISSEPILGVGVQRNTSGEPLFTVDGVAIGTVREVREFLDRADGEIRPKMAPVDRENSLIGDWLAKQQAAGAVSVDMKRLDDIRIGVRLALSGQ